MRERFFEISFRRVCRARLQLAVRLERLPAVTRARFLPGTVPRMPEQSPRRREMYIYTADTGITRGEFLLAPVRRTLASRRRDRGRKSSRLLRVNTRPVALNFLILLRARGCAPR